MRFEKWIGICEVDNIFFMKLWESFVDVNYKFRLLSICHLTMKLILFVNIFLLVESNLQPHTWAKASWFLRSFCKVFLVANIYMEARLWPSLVLYISFLYSNFNSKFSCFCINNNNHSSFFYNKYLFYLPTFLFQWYKSVLSSFRSLT